MRSAVWWSDDAIEILDQTLLPGEVRVLRLTNADAVIAAIQRLAVRGAPALGVTGALAVLLCRSDEEAERVASARPTAGNLRWGVERGLGALDRRAEALAVLEEDIAACRAIGAFGRAELASATRVMTVCNAGRLATAGMGSALAPIYAKHEAGEPVEVFACETRPLLQGARLTAWELKDAGIPVTVLIEGAAPTLLARGGIDAVIVGCDRVAANGDVANKIGTYALAIAAKHHGIPFYVAGPRSTLDSATATGAEIEIEERDGREV